MRFPQGSYRLAIVGAAGLAAGAIISGLYFAHAGSHPSYAINNNCFKQYPFTSQMLDCSTYDDSSARIHELDQKLDDAVDLYTKEGKATEISIWVRDLNTLQWASTNENIRYAPASLLKVPLMIAYYKVAELEPSLLNTKLVYTPSQVLNSDSQDFAPSNPLVVGQSYTVEQLLEHMIINSDNNAAAMLLNHIDPSIFDNTMIDLGIKIPGNTQNYDFVTAKTYGAIFRTLYNASYLNRDYSEKALELLGKAEFKGLAGQLPASVKVAHKFGEREVDNPDGSAQLRELHDCGIIYKDSNPYTICIMTQGKSFDDLLSVIQNLSLLAYSSL